MQWRTERCVTLSAPESVSQTSPGTMDGPFTCYGRLRQNRGQTCVMRSAFQLLDLGRL